MSRLVFLGSKSSGLNALKTALSCVRSRVCKVITFDDRNDARSCLEQFERLCIEEGLPFECIRPSELSAALEGHSDCKVLVVGWYTILGKDLLSRNDFYGIHYSPLPKYRGNAPLVWQIINGEKEIGITFFRFAEGMDDGDYVAQSFFPLEERDDIGSVIERADYAASDLLKAHLAAVVAGNAVLHPQDHELATYCGLRMPDDGLIDWRQSASQLVNFIRAQTSPYPGAFTIDEQGRKIFIWRALIEPRDIYAPIGAVFERTPDYAVIKCGEGALRVVSASRDGETSIMTVFGGLKSRLGVRCL